MQSRLQRIILTSFTVVLALVGYGLTLGNSASSSLTHSFDVDPHKLSVTTSTTSITDISVRMINDDVSRVVHAPSIVQLESGKLMTIWWGGSREGGKDVQIYSATLDNNAAQWSKATVLQSAKNTAAEVQRYVRKLGNAVLVQDKAGRLHIYYVSVSVGGWAASSINWIFSDDLGLTWSKSKRIITSPFLNLSTLTKGAAFFYADGSIALPVYHEFAGKFGELLRVSPEGEVLSKSRLSKNREAIQPVIHAHSKLEANALLRYTGKGERRVVKTSTTDGGLRWSEPTPINIPNPNSAVAITHHDTLGEIGVFNDLEDGREKLSLYHYQDTDEWRFVHAFEDKTSGTLESEATELQPWTLEGLLEEFKDTLHSIQDSITEDVEESISDEESQRIADSYRARLTEDLQQNAIPLERIKQVVERAVETMCDAEECEFQYDYPYLIQGDGNTYHVVYTWNKSAIKHISFTLSPVDNTL